jgi:aryl-alcohol dehydrogenase-like predicted oxidoreductase
VREAQDLVNGGEGIVELREVPGTEVRVSPICLGTMLYGRPVGRAEAIRLTRLAVDLGLNFIDTANIYEGYDRSLGSAGGVSEEYIGEALDGVREQVVITTKVGSPVGDGSDDCGLGRRHVLRELDKSLSRLRTDHVDFYLAHRPDPATPLEDVVGLFDSLVKAGKVRHWGFSNFEAADAAKMVEIARGSSAARPRLSQPPYSILKRGIEEDHLPTCRSLGIGVACYRPLEGGLLSGKYGRGRKPPAGSRAEEMPAWMPLEDKDEATFEKISTVCEMARAAGVTPAQYAIAWTIAQPGVTAAVAGIRREDQLRDAVGAGEFAFPDDDLARLDEIL